MQIKVKFEFIGSLKNNSILIESGSFVENGVEYVDKIQGFEINDFNETTVKDFQELRQPIYCAVKDFPGWVQAVFPTGRVIVLDKEQLD